MLYTANNDSSEMSDGWTFKLKCMLPIFEKILALGNRKFDEPNGIDKILDKVFLWAIPSFIRPNHLTVFRYLTIPMIFYLLINQFYIPGLVLFLISAFTDALDGALARTRRQITSWGKIHDPLADKLLIGVAGVVVVSKYIGIELILVILFLEMLTVIAALSLYNPKENPGARLPGKIKMVLQSLGLAVLLIFVVSSIPLLLLTSIYLFYLSIFFSILNLLLCIFFTKAL